MSWRKNGAGSRSWSGGSSRGKDRGDSSRGHGKADSAIEGVELDFVCRGVPVLTLDKASVFHENVSWMLQSALSSSGKADSLYEYCEDSNISKECRALGLRSEDVSLVRLKRPDLRHVKAVGTTGKRSVMLAVVVAMALEDGEALGDLWKELRAYKLEKAFVGLLQSGQNTVAKDTPIEPPPQNGFTLEGVELSIVRGCVPVLVVEKTSIFHENVSWLLQTATKSSGKADALYEYCNDRDIMEACHRMGLADQEVGLVRLRRDDLRHVKAVGTSGKRSIMLSLVVALFTHDEADFDDMMKEVWAYDTKLDEPFSILINDALRSSGKPAKHRPHRSGGGGDGWSGSKRKWDDDYDDDDWQSSGGSSGWARPANKRREGGSGGRRGDTNEKHLDKQLDDYWGGYR